MAGLKYSIVVDTLATFGLSIWEKPREVLEMVANAGYDAVDFTAEPDRIDLKVYREIAGPGPWVWKSQRCLERGRPGTRGSQETWRRRTKRSDATRSAMPINALNWQRS